METKRCRTILLQPPPLFAKDFFLDGQSLLGNICSRKEQSPIRLLLPSWHFRSRCAARLEPTMRKPPVQKIMRILLGHIECLSCETSGTDRSGVSDRRIPSE